MSNSSETATTTRAVQQDNVPRRRRIFQNFRLIWLDAHIDETNDDFRNSIIRLRCIINTIDTFTDPDRCIDFISEIKDEKTFVIVSGALSQIVIPLFHDMSQLNSIYVLCENKSPHEQWIKDWVKVKGVFTAISPICDSLKQATRQCDQDSIAISLLSPGHTSDQTLDHLDQSFMYTQILKEILLEIDNYDEQSIKDLTTYCREQCADTRDELNDITKFEEEYRLHSPIWWYTCECFLYPMLNRALRTQEMETIIKMGFFIRDLHKQVQQLHSNQFCDNPVQPFLVYRGQSLSQKDFENMQKIKGGLLAFNNFLSTSKNEDVSLGFAHDALVNPGSVGILFKMTIDPSVSSAPFALLDQVGYYRDAEEEILFSMHTIFRILDIIRIGNNDRLWQVDLMLTADNDQQLNALTKRMREETYEGSNGWYRLGQLLIKVGESCRAEQLYRVLLEQVCDDSEKAHVYYHLGWIKYHGGDNAEASSFYERSLELYQKTLPPNDPTLAAPYTGIGLVCYNMGKYSKALSYHEKSLEIQSKTLPPNHPTLAYTYSNIGTVYYKMGEYSKSLSNYEKSLEIRQETYLPNHPDLGASYNNVGLAYENMGEYSKAISYYEKALDIKQKTLPPNHPNLANSYGNMGNVYDKMGEYSKSLCAQEKALQIYQKTLPSNHPALAYSYNNIGLAYGKIDEYSTALSYHEKALEIQRETLPPNHPDLGAFYNNIGLVYYNMGEYSKAISYHEKALQISKENLSSNHPNLATLYNNVGNVYDKMGKYSEALSSQEKALAIQRETLSSNHPALAYTHSNIGSVYYNMNEYSTALSHYEKSLEIQRETLPPNHPDLAASYNIIGLVYDVMGECSKALSFQEKALKMSQETSSPNDPDLAAFYDNIGLKYDKVGEYSKAITFYERAVEIGQRSLHPDNPRIRQWRKNLENVKIRSCK